MTIDRPDMTTEQLEAAEIELERDVIERARERYHAVIAERGLSTVSPGMEMIRRSVTTLTTEIATWVAESEAGKAGRDAGMAKFIAQFDADEVAFVVLRSIVSAIGAGWTVTRTAMQIISTLEAVDLSERVRVADKRIYERYCRFVKRETKDNVKLALLKIQGRYLGEFGAKARYVWDPSIRLRLGTALVQIAKDATGIFDMVRRHTEGGKSQHASYVIEPSESAAAWLEKAHAFAEVTRPNFLPMVVPPRPWTSLDDGGYLTRIRGLNTRLIKTGNGIGQEMVECDLTRVFEAVNLLQETPWRINARILAVIQQAQEVGIPIPGLPAHVQVPEEPPRAAFMDLVPREQWTEEQVQAFGDWKRETRLWKEAHNRRAGRAASLSGLLTAAEAVAGFQRIYFPHQLDWRGRAYPIPTLLNPQGSDAAKGLLEFSEGVPLGRSGQRWLAIHLANAFGVDKVAYVDRVRWVRDNLDGIMADADEPLRADALWVNADAPFVFLAAAMEWAALMDFDGDPSEFVSHLPVAIDGSCNGLQHYSAMLRDPVGGRATNLVPADAPSDIYAMVAERARAIIEPDMAHDDPEVAAYARHWAGVGIDRKWTKRNTMTLPYGVSKFGMKDQLWEQIGGDAGSRDFFPEGMQRGAAVRYLAAVNWRAISEVVVASVHAMDWLRAVATAMNRAAPGGLPLTWFTPDGLPVQQRYLAGETIRVNCLGSTLKLHLKKYGNAMAPSKQVSGIAPNFVHSIDGAHMRAVTRRMASYGVSSFAMVHDSFGTHAGHMDLLAEVTREEFVEIHKTCVLDLVRQTVEPVLGEDMPPMPAMGDLDLERVKTSEYFFA